MDVPTTRPSSAITGSSSDTERHQYNRDDAAAVRGTERHLIIAENGRDRAAEESAHNGGGEVRDCRETVMDAYRDSLREESTHNGVGEVRDCRETVMDAYRESLREESAHNGGGEVRDCRETVMDAYRDSLREESTHNGGGEVRDCRETVMDAYRDSLREESAHNGGGEVRDCRETVMDAYRDSLREESAHNGGGEVRDCRETVLVSYRDSLIEESAHNCGGEVRDRRETVMDSYRDSLREESAHHGGGEVRDRRETVLDSYRDNLTSLREESVHNGGGEVRDLRHPILDSYRDSLTSLREESAHHGGGEVRDCRQAVLDSYRDSLKSLREESAHLLSHGGGEHTEVRDRPPVRGRKETVPESYRDGLTSLREESARRGYDRAWDTMSGFQRALSSTSEGTPHPVSGYERLSVDRAHTMKDFEKQITELKKENFNLKLRIYFLEEQVQRRCDTSNDELHRMNIELKVELESLKHDFQEKHNLLVRASKAMESVAGEHEVAVKLLREDHLKHLQDMEDAQSHKLQLLEDAIQHEKDELEKMCLLLDQEQIQRFAAEERLMALNEQYTKSMAILEERDWIIQCLNDTVHSKDALIAQLEKQIASMMPYKASDDQIGKNVSNLYLEGDAKDLPGPPKSIHNVDGKENANEWQEKIKEMDNLINELQQKLEDNKAGLAAEEKNTLKRDKAIQGLTMALKKKTKENNKLQSEIDRLDAALKEAAQQAQLQSLKENIHPEYKKLIFTLQAEEDIYNRLLKYERESGNLQKELESIAMLRRWLEGNIQANQELRKIMEAQIMARYNGDDSMSLLGDQTSYLSICLDHLNQNEYFFAGGPQGTALYKNNTHEMFNHLKEEAGTQTQSNDSALPDNNLIHQQDLKSGQSVNERSPLPREDSENYAQPIRNKQNTVSSAMQTELSAVSDRCFAVSVSRLPEEKAEIMWTLQDRELHIPSQSNNTCENQDYNFSRRAKKSRLPVLLKSSLNTKVRTDVALTLAKEDEHSCLQKESQIENSQFYIQPKCAKMEVESFEETIDYIPDLNNVGQEQKDPVEQIVHRELHPENHRLSEESKQTESESTSPKANEKLLKYKVSDLCYCKKRESTDRALKELQAENYLLLQQLEQVQMENKTPNPNKDLLRNKTPEHELSNSRDDQRRSTEQVLHKELREENYQLSELLKQAQVETKSPQANEELIKHKKALPDLSGIISELRESADQKLQAENCRLSEQLKQAHMEIKILKANEEMIRNKASECDLSNPKDEEKKLAEQGFQKELQAENYQLSEQVKRSQMEIERLKANVESIKQKDTLPDLSGSIREQRESTDQELQAENCRLSEQLILAQMEVETLRANEELWKSRSSKLDLSHSKDEQRKSTEQALQKELQAENNGLSEQLKRTQIEVKTFKINEELLRCKVSEIEELPNDKAEWRTSTECALLKELQAENYRLSEQLKRAQMEIETLKANEHLIKHEDIVHNLSHTFKGSRDQSLQKELQAEQCRLSERLKTAQMNIEKLQAEQRSTGSSDDSMKLHGSDADDDLSEQSFLEKTITNFNVIEVDATSDFGDEVCRPHVISHNAAALRCHHDSHCTECAHNRGSLPLPSSKSKRASTRHSSSKFTKVSSARSFEDTTSLSKYDLLVQSQARELSLQRQKIKESHNLSVICSKNFYNLLKAFENLFPVSTLDSNIPMGFQEQITQTIEWLKELEYKLSDTIYGEEDVYSDHSVDSLLYTPSRLVPGHRMWADKHGCHVLGLVEDYNALRKQILEARNVLQETEAFIDHGVQTAVLNMTEHFGNIFFEKLTRTKQSLEEAGCLLKLLWRVSLPLQIHSPYSVNQDKELNLEVTRLRKRVVEQEKLLSGMVKRVYSENQMKEDIEKLILDQLAVTHDILRRAKGNLEVQVVDKLH
ncbi:CDK5 regulatory subunit-associated protein 2-like [Hyla sarda]|uniref:CDK5 regulatory subunit-associated protein 2-like n=1 Tax=Hyla sarda TaxID=327740 RepID=UPI0024C3261D|nr:CDK5 regulatory subunit-associated protein 2-like [Hyla sarda]